MLLLSILLLSFVVGETTHPDTARAAERQALMRIDRHLAELAPLIVAAEEKVDPDARVRFRFDWLRRDVAILRRGIQARIQPPADERPVSAPLYGDYRR